jgi:uncharacterized protein
MTKQAPFRSPWWLPGGHAQTIAPLTRKGALPRYRRERIDTPDGDFIDLDWLSEPTADAPLVALFHGLEGSSGSHYARSLMHTLQSVGWRGVVPHFRGCSGEPNRLARAYHSGDTDEIDWILRHLYRAAGTAPLFAVGVSLGGNALLKWMGERELASRELLTGAAAVCPPLDLSISGAALGRGFNRIYSMHFLQSLKRKALEKSERHPGLFDPQAVRSARSLRDFDDVYTGPMHGFSGVEDYWRRASSKPWLGAISTPTLLVCAANDPFVPPAALPGQCELSPRVAFECAPTGGHVGFMAGPWPGSIAWLPHRLLAHFADLR